MKPSVVYFVILFLASAAGLAAAAVERKLVMIAGPVSHPPLQHEFRAGSMLLEKRLREVPGLKTVLVTNGWPSKVVDGKKLDDNSIFDGADAIFIYSDGGPNHLALQNGRLEVLRALIQKGVSLGCAHYAVEVPPTNGGAEWKEWIGGHYVDKVSVNPMWEPSFATFPVHPITRGVKPFHTRDEWYFNLQFREGKKGVTDLLVATPSDAVRNGPYVFPAGPYPDVQAAKGRAETMMFAVERPDSGRGFGFTGGHFHLNWQNDDQRRLVLNALVWLSKLEVPPGGINSAPVSDAEAHENLDDKPGRPAQAPAAPAEKSPAVKK